MLNKEKEEWTLQTFMELFNGSNKNKLNFLRRVPNPEASGPDFIVKMDVNGNIGIEVTTLYDSPSCETAEQNNRISDLMHLLEAALEKEKITAFNLCLYKCALPDQQNLSPLVNGIVSKLKELLQKRTTLPVEIAVNGQGIEVSACNPDASPTILSDLLGEKGDRETWMQGVKERLTEKAKKGISYLKSQPNWLVVYDNSNYGIFAYTQSELPAELLPIESHVFERIFIFRDKKYREIPLTRPIY